MAAPARCSGASPDKGGTAIRFLPQMIFMAPLKMMESPMVRKISTRWLSERDGRMPTTSTRMATKVTPATAATRAGAMGRPAVTRAL